MRWELHYIRVYPTIFSCVDPRSQLSRFFTEMSSRRYGELIYLIGNQRVGIFPPKSEILFVLSLALIWCRNFQDRTIPVGGDTWPSFWRKERRITRYTSARQYVKPYEKKSREQSSRTVTWQSAEFQTKFVRLSNQVGGDATVGRLSNNCFPRYQAIGRIFEKSRWTVTRQWSEVTRLSADCQTTFFGRSNRFVKILKKVAERSRDSGRRSRDRRPTVKQRFLDVPIDLGKFWKKVAERSRDSGWGHATVGRLSNNVFWTFQAIWENFEKSRRTVTRQWSEVTRPSADCQTTFFGRFKQLEIFLKKVAERSRDSGRRSRDCRPTVKQRVFDVWSN